MLRSGLLAAAACLVAFGLYGCGNDKESTETGTWTFSNVNCHGVQVSGQCRTTLAAPPMGPSIYYARPTIQMTCKDHIACAASLDAAKNACSLKSGQDNCKQDSRCTWEGSCFPKNDDQEINLKKVSGCADGGQVVELEKAASSSWPKRPDINCKAAADDPCVLFGSSAETTILCRDGNGSSSIVAVNV